MRKNRLKHKRTNHFSLFRPPNTLQMDFQDGNINSLVLPLYLVQFEKKHMTESEYEKSLEFVVKMFNIFQKDVIQYIQRPSASPQLVDILQAWVHPRGIPALIKSFTLDYQVALPFPQVSKSIQEMFPPEVGQSEKKSLVHLTPQAKAVTSSHKSRRSKKITLINFNKEMNPLKKQKIFMENEESEGQQNSSSYNGEEGRSYKRGPYKSYSMEEKLRAVSLFNNQHLSVTEISRTLGIPCKNIKRWAVDGVDRKRGGGRKRTNPSLEEEVYRWLAKQHMFGGSVSIDEIQSYALSRSNDPAFKASRGWATKFIDRFNLRSRYSIV